MAASRGRPSTTLRPLRSGPLACCMYCLARGVQRTEEHLIPRALGGRWTLRDAVCEPCRRLTGGPEQATLERDFLVPRTLLALKRRRARAHGPARLPPVLLAGESAPSALTADEFPRSYSLAAFDPAGLLAGSPRADAPRMHLVACRLDLGTPKRHTVAAASPPADARTYGWAIGKWAYALAVAERGLDGFETQPLRDLMLGRRDDVFAFVGTPSPRADASREWLHDFALHEDGPWLVVRLALFASAGMTPYEVVVGRLPAPGA